MSHFVVFEAGDDGIFAAGNSFARRRVMRQSVRRGEIIWLEVGNGCQVGRDVLADFFEVWLLAGLDARGDGLIR